LVFDVARFNNNYGDVMLDPNGSAEILYILVPALILLLIDIITIVAITKSKNSENEKLVWVIVVIFLPVIGPILYMFIGHDYSN
jgi:heme/copper-type cytochrome/quinol oxidase subunit 2